jgi:hypothetical protein
MKKIIVVLSSLLLVSSLVMAEENAANNTSTSTSTASPVVTSISTASPVVTSTSTVTAATTATSTNSGVTGNSVVVTSPDNIAETVIGTQTLKNTPSVNGPALVSSNDTCMGSTSGSLNIAGLGFGGGSTWTDTNCRRLKNARELWNMGMKPAALAIMCMDSENKEALELTGYLCPVKPQAKPQVKAETDPIKNVTPLPKSFKTGMLPNLSYNASKFLDMYDVDNQTKK